MFMYSFLNSNPLNYLCVTVQSIGVKLFGIFILVKELNLLLSQNCIIQPPPPPYTIRPLDPCGCY